MRFSLKQFGAVIFDMDGVLINSEPLWEESDLKVFKKEIGLTGYTKEYRAQFLGMPMEDEIKVVAADFKIARDRIPSILEARRKSLMELYRERLELFEGALELLEYFSRDKKIALASSSSLDLINFVVDRFNIRKYFEVLVSGEEVAHGKPFPDVFLLAARKLMVKPEKCLVIEDSVNGVKAGKAAGMKVIAVLQTFKEQESFSCADWVFDDLVSLHKKLGASEE